MLDDGDVLGSASGLMRRGMAESGGKGCAHRSGPFTPGGAPKMSVTAGIRA
jgi:hypothetical protein